MEKSLLVIVRHKPGRTRLLMRALQSINDQTFKKINIIIFCMEEELKCHNVDDFYLKELSSFALRFSTVTAKRASGVAALLKRQHCPHARFTGARIARNSRNRHRRAAIA